MKYLSLAAVAATSIAVSACSVIMPEQALTVTTPEPGAQVYMALHGDRSMGVNGGGIAGNIPMGRDDTSFAYIGDTPLDHTFYTTRYENGVMVPGEFSSNQRTFYTEATIRVVFEDGSREERRVRLNNQHISLDFDGRSSGEAK